MKAGETSAGERERRAVPCPRCGYDLSGVVSSWTESCPLEGVCSECGREFLWPDLLARRRFRGDPQVANWSFEHAEHGLARAFVLTSVRSLTPMTLFGGLSCFDPVRWKRLLTFLLLCVLVWGLVSLFPAALLDRIAGGGSTSTTYTPYGYSTTRTIGHVEVVLWIALALPVFMMFHLTNSCLFALLGVGRAPVRVRAGHVWRVNLYAMAGLLNGWSILSAVVWSVEALESVSGVSYAVLYAALGLAALVGIVWFALWLAAWWGIAIQEYFRGESSSLNWLWFVVFPGVVAALVMLWVFIRSCFA